MSIKLMYITNNPKIAKIADSCGVDRIFVDLEKVGKAERQASADTVLSNHSMEDIAKVKASLSNAQIIVRSNPIHAGSKDELEAIANSRADIVMLPYFTTADEARYFISAIGGRKRTCLLFETPAAVENAEEILSIGGIDEVFVGLNDLHLGYKMKFLFEPLADGTVDKLCELFVRKGVPYGFGGIARLNSGTLPAQIVLGEHYRLGSGCVILSRSFCNTSFVTELDQINGIFTEGVRAIREYEKFLTTADAEFFEDNRRQLVSRVNAIVGKEL